MIVDTSALTAVLYAEEDADTFSAILSSNRSGLRMSAASYVELGVVIDRDKDTPLTRQVDELIAELAIEIVPLTVDQARIARDAHRRYGRGSGHPARLNFGDCFAYALAKDTGEPLLFKGRDFSVTDIPAALTI